MHILEIPSFFPPYGGDFCLQQAKALQAEGHEVRILSNVQLSVKRSLGQFVMLPWGREELVMEGVEVSRSFMRGMPKVVRPNVSRWLKIVRSMFREYADRHGRPDVIHAHCAKWAGYAAMLIGRDEGIPYVITEHLSSAIFREEFGEDYQSAWQVPLLREAYQHARVTIMVSDRQASDLAPFFGNDFRQTVLSNMIDTDFFAFSERPPRQGRNFTFCCLANFIPLKGYDILFQAFERLRQCGCQAELLIAGSGTDGQACRELMASLAPSGGITACGLLSRDGVRDVLRRSHCMVLASRSEAQPLSLLEAMSTGIPVVATTCVPPSLRLPGGCDVVPVGDVQALAGAMMKRASEEAVDGRRLSREVSEMASPAVIGKRLSAVLQEAAQG